MLVTGYYAEDYTPVEAILLFFDGTSWNSITTPPNAVRLGEIHGSSMDDLYIIGLESDNTSVVYHVTDNLGQVAGPL